MGVDGCRYVVSSSECEYDGSDRKIDRIYPIY